MTADIRPPVDVFFGAGVFGVATADGRRVIVEKAVGLVPPGGDLQATERRTVLHLRRSEWPSVLRDTTITVTEGLDAGVYTVDSVLADDGEVVRVTVR